MPPKDFSSIQNSIDPIRTTDPALEKIVPEATGADVSSNTLKTIRTYASDMATAIKQKQGSVMKIALAEKERRDEDALAKNPVSRKNIVFTFGAILLLILGGVALYFGVLAKRAPKVIEDAPVQNSQALITGVVQPVVGSTKAIMQESMKNLIASGSHELDTATMLVFTLPETQTPITATTFLETNSFDLSAGLKRSLDELYSIGIYTLDGNTPFLVIKSDSYDTAYIGMLATEKTLYSDIMPLFGLPEKDSNESVFLTASFTDNVIANQDVRAIKNVANEYVFFYSVRDDGTIIMTTDPGAFKALIALVQ